MRNLDELIKEYEVACAEVDVATAKKDELANEIKEQLQGKLGKTFTTEDGTNAKLVESVRFTYDDSVAIINYLTQKGLKSTYITESIDTKKLNAELKKAGTLYDGVKPYVTKTITESLRVGK